MADELAELKAEVKRLHAKIQKVEGGLAMIFLSYPKAIVDRKQMKQKSGRCISSMVITLTNVSTTRSVYHLIVSTTKGIYSHSNDMDRTNRSSTCSQTIQTHTLSS